MMAKLSIDEAKELLGEGLHKALRVMGNSEEAARAYVGIDKMNEYEWDNILNFVVLGLADMGVNIVKDE